MGAEGVACLDVGFPLRYSHSALEVVDVEDLLQLTTLLDAAMARIGPGFDLGRT
jgi:putative aminopeptidase FrvX